MLNLYLEQWFPHRNTLSFCSIMVKYLVKKKKNPASVLLLYRPFSTVYPELFDLLFIIFMAASGFHRFVWGIKKSSRYIPQLLFFPPKDCIVVKVSRNLSYQVSMDFFLFLKDTHHIYERRKVNHQVIRKRLSEFGPWEHPVTHQQRLQDAGCILLSSWCDFDNESKHPAHVCGSTSSSHCKTIPVAARRLEIKLEIDWWMTSLKWSAEM